MIWVHLVPNNWPTDNPPYPCSDVPEATGLSHTSPEHNRRQQDGFAFFLMQVANSEVNIK